jgi:hypothetical protein
LLQHIFLNDIYDFANKQWRDPPAYVIIDPKGTDLVEPLARLAIFDQWLRERIVIIDPLDKPAINLFQNTGEAGQVISNFSYIFSTVNQQLTGQQETCFSFCVRLIYGMPGATLFTLLDLLDEDPRRPDPRFSVGDPAHQHGADDPGNELKTWRCLTIGLAEDL